MSPAQELINLPAGSDARLRSEELQNCRLLKIILQVDKILGTTVASLCKGKTTKFNTTVNVQA